MWARCLRDYKVLAVAGCGGVAEAVLRCVCVCMCTVCVCVQSRVFLLCVRPCVCSCVHPCMVGGVRVCVCSLCARACV